MNLLNNTRSANVSCTQSTRSGPVLIRRLGFAVAITFTFASTVMSLDGCARQALPSPGSSSLRVVSAAHAVPTAPPDYFPRELIDSLGTIRAGDDTLLTVVRSMLKVFLKGDAAQLEQQQPIDLVGGTVVGGFRIADTDGEYFVRIPGSTYDDIQTAIRKLQGLPQVKGAFPFFVNVRVCCGEANSGLPVQ